METQIFEFKDYRVPVRVGGVDFMLDCSAETGAKLKNSGAELYRLAQELEQGEGLQEAMDYCCGLVDALLGEGAVDKIFASRRRALADVAQVLNWLTGLAVKYGENSR